MVLLIAKYYHKSNTIKDHNYDNTVELQLAGNLKRISNPCQNIWQKVKKNKYNQTRQKTMIYAFAYSCLKVSMGTQLVPPSGFDIFLTHPKDLKSEVVR